MILEKSCGAVVYRIIEDKRFYLLLNYAAGHWDLSKGHVEAGESEKDTVLRELAEETQITDAVFDEGFREELSYSFSRGDELVDKTVVFYLLETKTEDVVLSLEHRDFLWLDYINARDKLTYDNTKKILDKAKKHLTP